MINSIASLTTKVAEIVKEIRLTLTDRIQKIMKGTSDFYMACLKKELEVQLSSSSPPTTSKFSDLRIDINPSSWLRPYRRTSIGYLTKMLLFYHGVGILIMIIGTTIIQNLVPEYQDVSVPLSIISVLSAGPIEEILFFGLPYYIFGNHLVVLGGGMVWVMLHILNTDTFELTTLSYANWLFVIPSLFFSLRTWISGKGWFAVLTHSLWNGIFFTLGCLVGEVSCNLTLQGSDLWTSSSSLWLSAILIVLVFILYKRKPSRTL